MRHPVCRVRDGGNTRFENRTVVKIENPANWFHRIAPEIICVNRKTGKTDVSKEFFTQVWGDWSTDKSWNGWLCLNDDNEVIGCIIIQVFVHESQYFRWGPPLFKKAKGPLAKTGEFPNIGEIAFFCAQKCGTLLLEVVEDWVAENTTWEFLVISSTQGAADWYRSKGFKDVKAFRLNMYAKSGDHLYRHRIADFRYDRNIDPPSIMLFKEVNRDRIPREPKNPSISHHVKTKSAPKERSKEPTKESVKPPQKRKRNGPVDDVRDSGPPKKGAAKHRRIS